jgi:hypothetical protein
VVGAGLRFSPSGRQVAVGGALPAVAFRVVERRTSLAILGHGASVPRMRGQPLSTTSAAAQPLGALSRSLGDVSTVQPCGDAVRLYRHEPGKETVMSPPQRNSSARLGVGVTAAHVLLVAVIELAKATL